MIKSINNNESGRKNTYYKRELFFLIFPIHLGIGEKLIPCLIICIIYIIIINIIIQQMMFVAAF